MRLVAIAAAGALGLIAAGCGGNSSSSSASKPVSYAAAQAVFAKYQCAACHPIVNPSLDMRPAHTYASIVGVQALEDPRLVRVVAGDPEQSFLYQKIAGDPKLGDIPAIGARMPQNAPRMAQADIDTIRAWIEQGAKNAQGKTVGPTVPTPGSPGPSPTGSEPKGPTGDATISGVVEDQQHKPLAGALVTLLLRGSDQPGGEEHYRVAATDAAGHYTLTHAPTGQYLLKAYSPLSIYVSRIVALKSGQKATVDFGLPRRVIPNPNVAAPAVTASGRTLAMTVSGSSLDPNYTLAANPQAGVVYELHNAGDRPGRWRRTVPKRLPGRWIFLAVDHQCNISDFVTVGA